VHRLKYSKSELALSLSDGASHTKRTRVVLRDDSLCLLQEKRGGEWFFMGAYRSQNWGFDRDLMLEFATPCVILNIILGASWQGESFVLLAQVHLFDLVAGLASFLRFCATCVPSDEAIASPVLGLFVPLCSLYVSVSVSATIVGPLFAAFRPRPGRFAAADCKVLGGLWLTLFAFRGCRCL
jgi:hypothetical protein